VSSAPEILVTRRLPSAVIEKLALAGPVDQYSEPHDLSAKELRVRVEGKAGLICVVTDQIDEALIDAGQDLQVIASLAVGVDNIDLPCAASRGIVVTNTPDVLTESAAEYTWGLILAVTRRIAEADRVARAGKWSGWTLDFMLGTELGGKQLGIVGAGRIGRAVAARAGAFGMEVAVVDRPGHDMEGQSVRRMSFDELLVTSDVISLHVPLTDTTRHLIDRRRLARMKRSAFLVNTSRGPVVDEAALVWALTERLISGAALDVYEHEPKIHPDLVSLDNVVLSPHIGTATRETRTAMAELAVSNVVAVLGGRPPLTPVGGVSPH
jgi:glyoxylate reductase